MVKFLKIALEKIITRNVKILLLLLLLLEFTNHFHNKFNLQCWL